MATSRADQHNMDATSGMNGRHVNGKSVDNASPGSFKRVLVVGGGPVGCLAALKLGQAGIDVDIIEKLPATSDAPRACGYFGAVHFFLNEIGMYKLIREQGFMTRGLVWRTMPKDDGKGGKTLGDVIGVQPLCAPDDTVLDVGSGLLNLPQADINKLFLHEALKTGHVRIYFRTELVSILQNTKDGVAILIRDVETGAEKQYQATYLVGADGAHSMARKALGLSFPGHTWPERIIATDVLVKNEPAPIFHTHFVMDRTYYSIATPLEDPVPGKTTLWRYSLASDPNDSRTDEELMSNSNIMSAYERNMHGPRPLQAQIQARAIYRIHQRLVSTMRKGNCLLAGDAAHLNNPLGALGLNTGILDADAATEALIMVLNEGCSDSVLDVYSDERRKVFQFFVDPTSTQNKLRLHSHDVSTAVQDDWYLRMINHPTPEKMLELMKPYFETWRTDMRKVTKGMV
ncbi:uncharacterized protein Z518_01268 [Rhinocladiella mackenziei CBS 650.93]|uniref:FAD-binding domain-containing protein n=1 Tax=Rhinocladiella mackenziei CBS 650.93 TaxID=1442369 RepID=A0A0D2G5M6_9EURO|nr:uncharacterized protein Z518_01268 [Rhinocladiella mackenziei CBS 650.93]KIX10187.1 hypothetical protein Z518_01268 [Rhinocladiella mackenziei CBS 650.93]